jgi:hypothetical protein
MITEYVDASDEINARFWSDWESKSPEAVGYVPEVRWQNVEEPNSIDGSKFWARVSLQTVFEEQSTLSNCEGAPWQKRYTVSGIVFVQIFCPKSEARSSEQGKLLSKIARNSFRGKATDSKIWFRRARINELAPEDLFYRFNVIADFEYDELG